MRKTPLFEAHERLSARMIDFGGWSMPVQYENVMAEHNATRTAAGLFDVCHMGEIIVKGKDSQKLLQLLVTNNVSGLVDGQVMYSAMCYENGTVVDDIMIYRLREDHYMIVVNAANAKKDIDWISDHADGLEADVEDVSDSMAKIDIQGPNAAVILQKITDTELREIGRFSFREGLVDGMKTLISRTGYTGEDGFELYIDSSLADRLWEKILEVGKEHGIKPAGLGARDVLRIESCYSLYGNEISDTITLVEGGLAWLVRPEKGDFIGRDVLEKQKAEGAERVLVCFEMVDRAVPREQYEIQENGEKVGSVTSGTFSPIFKKGIGMGLVKRGSSATGNEISIIIRGREYKARIVKKPFYVFRGGK